MRSGPDSRGDGDGWVRCDAGHRHWGLFGAAGLLLCRPGDDTAEVLLQHRAEWSHHGGTWGLPGGARHRGETATAAALREAAEEGGLDPDDVRVHGRFDDVHGGWSYVTVLGTAPAGTSARPTGGESIDVSWVPVTEVDDLPLHPGFGQSWPRLRSDLAPVTLVVDAANVVGSRPDGWWRDRAGAARKLIERCRRLAEEGVPGGAGWPSVVGTLDHRWPRLVVVLEGAARTAADAPSGRVEVLAAQGEGDDTIAAVAESAAAAGPVVVVTADRALRARVADVGAATVGPRWLTDQLPSS